MTMRKDVVPGPRMRRRLTIVAAAALGLCIAAAATSAQVTRTTAPAPAARTELGPWGFDLGGMDRSVRPGEDFARFANGGWSRANPIPSDQSANTIFDILEERAAQQTRAILEEAARTPGSRIGDFYASFMDRAAVDARGLAALSPILERIEAARTPAELGSLMGDLVRISVDAPFDGGVDSDDRDRSVAIFQLNQGGLGLPDRDAYLGAAPDQVTRRDAYRAYLVRLLRLTDATNPEPRAAAVVDLETRIAQAHWTPADSRDASRTYNRMSPEQVRQSAPAFPWAAFFAAVGAAGQQTLIVRQPSAIARSAEILAAASPDVVRDYLRLHLLDSHAPYLSQPFVEANFAFRGTILEGIPQNRPEWRRATDLVSFQLADDVGRIYVERHFPPEAKAEADRLVRNIIATLDRRLQNLRWMAPETRARARAKLATFTPEIGVPPVWRDYSRIEIRRDDLAGNVMRANRGEHQRMLDMLGRPVTRGVWWRIAHAMMPNAYANPKWNQIVFGAAIFQPPFFDAHADPAVNYGAIGAVIAHEITHNFDDQGSKYDETGALRDWWTPADVQRFNALTDQLVEQFNRYEIFPGQFVNGRLTIGDNIGDLAGITIAYDAYRTSLGGREAPVLDGTTGDQRFFLGWAQIWRGNLRDEVRRQRLLTDPHAPAPQRVWTVRNLDAWYRAFDIAPGDPLYLPPEQRVRIW